MRGGIAKPKLIYVASSWRNPHYEGVLDLLRLYKLKFYDFKREGFNWRQARKEITPGYCTVADYEAAMDTRVAKKGLQRDLEALKAADACVLVLPSGRSSHLELGHAVGAGKRTFVLLPINTDEQIEPELMLGAADQISSNRTDMLRFLGAVR